jgi:uncharacterized protein
MASFGVVFFFAITGLTLNHPDWFSAAPRVVQAKGALQLEWMSEPSKLEIVEEIRNRHRVAGTLSDFRIEDDQLAASFKGPAYTADAIVDRKTGSYELTVTTMGLVALLNDLHKGRDTGAKWAWLIDASAILLAAASATGLVLLWFVYKRRVSGYVLAAIGSILAYLVYRLWVP